MSQYLQKLSQKLFSDVLEREKFVNSITHPQPMGSAIVRSPSSVALPFAPLARRPEQPPFVERLAPESEPGKTSEHERGEFYILDYSSVLATLPLSIVPTEPELLVDLCAAPGGKSVLASRFLNPHLLIANEVGAARCKALISNLKRCGIRPSRVWNNEVEDVVAALENEADVVLIDAPCSGQSLLAKGEKVPGAFHPSAINGNSNRQKKILSRAAPLVKTGGFILYSTCTYSPEENEDVIKWFLKRFQGFRAVEVPALAAIRSHLSDFPSYRVYPQFQLGAGSFSVLLQKNEESRSERTGPILRTREPREMWRQD